MNCSILPVSSRLAFELVSTRSVRDPHATDPGKTVIIPVETTRHLFFPLINGFGGVYSGSSSPLPCIDMNSWHVNCACLWTLRLRKNLECGQIVGSHLITCMSMAGQTLSNTHWLCLLEGYIYNSFLGGIVFSIHVATHWCSKYKLICFP